MYLCPSMARRNAIKLEDITPSLLKFREKRKWQITLRRYVLDKSPCPAYAPYFGLDIEQMRKWFESQFPAGLGWEDFGVKWQFDHVVPVSCFDFEKEEDLKLCWGFINLRPGIIEKGKEAGVKADLALARKYFQALWEQTGYSLCEKMLQKIQELEQSPGIPVQEAILFINSRKTYLQAIENYSSYAFELLNSGRSLEEISKEMAIVNRIDDSFRG